MQNTAYFDILAFDADANKVTVDLRGGVRTFDVTSQSNGTLTTTEAAGRYGGRPIDRHHWPITWNQQRDGSWKVVGCKRRNKDDRWPPILNAYA